MNPKLKTPWIPPPGKSQRFSKSTKNSDFFSIQDEVVKLETLVKSLESLFGKSKKHGAAIALPQLNKPQFKNNDNILEAEDKIESRYKKYKKYAKKLKTDLNGYKVELDKLRRANVENKLAFDAVAKDCTFWKIELTKANNDKIELETRIRQLQQILDSSKIPEEKTNDLHKQDENLQILAENKQLHALNVLLEDRFLQAQKDIFVLNDHVDRFNKMAEKEEKIAKNEQKIAKNYEIANLEKTVKKLNDTNHVFQNDIGKLQRKFRDAQQSISTLTRDLSQTEKTFNQQFSTLKLNETIIHHPVIQPQQRVDTTTCSNCHRNEQSTEFRELKIELQNQRDSLLEKTIKMEAVLEKKNSEITALENEKYAMEQKYTIKVQDQERKIQQYLSSNQSLQNYVAYLRNSYATVFTDSALQTATI